MLGVLRVGACGGGTKVCPRGEADAKKRGVVVVPRIEPEAKEWGELTR